MQNKYKSKFIVAYVKIILSSLVCLLCFAFLCLKSIEAIRNDTAVKGINHLNDTIFKASEDPVNPVLQQMQLNKTLEATDLIYELIKNPKIPEDVRDYFSDTLEYLVCINSQKLGRTQDIYTEIQTENFVKSSVVLENYFLQNKYTTAQEAKEKASVIPYFLIKNFDSTQKNQAELRKLYDEYITTFVTGKTSITKYDANIFCLYVYATYQGSKRGTENYKDLKNQIENFVTEYSNEISIENGSYQFQAMYLHSAIELLTNYPNRKSYIRTRWMQPYYSNYL